MKLYDGGRAPNPRRVRIFLAEKNITVPLEPVDLGSLQHKTEAYAAINPLQRLPALQLDDGTVITESIAICRYIEGLRPEPPLFGRGALEEALVEVNRSRTQRTRLVASRRCAAAAFSAGVLMPSSSLVIAVMRERPVLQEMPVVCAS